jgi:ribosomal-protein-alanine N-acetyltransferase
MAASPVLETPRLRIEPFAVERQLSARYVGWLNDPELTRFSEQRHRQHTLESCRQYAASFDDTPHYFWAVLAVDPTRPALDHIGNMNAYVTPAHGLADVGILIGERAAAGRGYATEAWMAVCDFLLRTAGLRKVTAGCLAVNAAMLRVMDRAGMQEDGRRLRHHLWNGQEVDVVHRALHRDAWLERFPVPALSRTE